MDKFVDVWTAEKTIFEAQALLSSSSHSAQEIAFRQDTKYVWEILILLPCSCEIGDLRAKCLHHWRCVSACAKRQTLAEAIRDLRKAKSPDGADQNFAERQKFFQSGLYSGFGWYSEQDRRRIIYLPVASSL